MRFLRASGPTDATSCCASRFHCEGLHWLLLAFLLSLGARLVTLYIVKLFLSAVLTMQKEMPCTIGFSFLTSDGAQRIPCIPPSFYQAAARVLQHFEQGRSFGSSVCLEYRYSPFAQVRACFEDPTLDNHQTPAGTAVPTTKSSHILILAHLRKVLRLHLRVPSLSPRTTFQSTIV